VAGPSSFFAVWGQGSRDIQMYPQREKGETTANSHIASVYQHMLCLFLHRRSDPVTVRKLKMVKQNNQTCF